MTRENYVRKFWPLALEVGSQYGISPVAMIAHALKESGAGNERAAARHNYFGFLKGGRHLVYPDALTGWTAYAKRLATRFPAVVDASGNGAAFAYAVAFAKNPAYVAESTAGKVLYADTLRKIYRSVAQDVARLNLQNEPIAGVSAKPAFKPSTTGEACIKRIVANDQVTHRLLVRCQAMQLLNVRRGRKLPALDAELARLTKSYNARQKRISESRLLKIEHGVSEDVKAVMDKLKSWFSISGPIPEKAYLGAIGALPLAVVIPVAIAGLAVAGYLVMKAFGGDEKKSVQDVKDAAHMDQQYQTMTPDQQKFFDAKLDEAGKAGYKSGQENNLFTTGIMVAGGLLLVNMFMNRSRPNN